MKTQPKRWLAAALVTALSVGGFRAQGAPTAALGQPDGGHRRGMVLEKRAALGLTEEQKATVKQALQKHQPTLQPLANKLLTEQRALQDLIHSGQADERAIRAQAGKVAAVAADLAVARAKLAQELRPILTAEQISKLQELKDEFRDRVDDIRARVAKRLRAE